MSLTEVLVFTTVALVLAMCVHNLLRRSVASAGATSASIGVQVGARCLLENLAADVKAAHAILAAEPGRITIARYGHPTAEETLAANPEKGYPFYVPAGVTRQRLPVTLVRYEHDAGKGTVTRSEARSQLDLETDPGGTDLLHARRGSATHVSERILAREVETFRLRYFGYGTKDGKLVSLAEARKTGAMGAEPVRRVAMVALHLKAIHDNLSDKLRDSAIEIATKIWSNKLGADAHYRPWFSSADYDTRY